MDGDLIEVYWHDEAQEFIAFATELPGCVGRGPNANDAIRDLRQSVVEFLELYDQGYYRSLH